MLVILQWLFALLIFINVVGALLLTLALSVDREDLFPERFYVYHVVLLLILPAFIFAYIFTFLITLPIMYITKLKFWHRPLFGSKRK